MTRLGGGLRVFDESPPRAWNGQVESWSTGPCSAHELLNLAALASSSVKWGSSQCLPQSVLMGAE